MSAPPDLAGAHGRAFWEGLGTLAEAPAYAARLASAFPDLVGAADWKRRDILRCLGGALALAGLDGCERVADGEAVPYVIEPEGQGPGTTRFYTTMVELDGVAQPILGKTFDGRPIKLEGNPDHPASRGATDAFTQAALLGLYDPDRSAAPRLGTRLSDWTRYDAAIAKLRAALDRSGGAGFRLLTGAVGSPTLERQIAALLARWPEARWHSWAAVPPRDERLSLDRAHVVVSFDDDPIGPGPLQTWHAAGWSARRRAYQAGDGSAALFVAEPVPTLTGLMASDRLVAPAGRMTALLNALAARCGAIGRAPIALTSRERAWLDAAMAALAAHRGQGLVTVGPQHPPALQALARAIDAQLGNAARAPVAASAAGDTRTLVEEMARGEVTTLLLLDVNPAYEAPHLGFAAAMAKVPLVIHAGLHVDETAARAHWHVPLAHALESWSDGRAADGSAVLAQPLVRPWLPVRSRHALLAGLLGDPASDREVVRATWRDRLDDAGWSKALVAGSIPEAPAPATSAADATPVAALETAGDALEVLIRPDPGLWDGRFASNPWLQELPRPLTRLTWGNAVHIAPALARAQGLEEGDRVRVAIGGRSVEGPVLILPGQARGTILVHLGFGRTAGSHVAQGVGFDAGPLLGASGAVSLTRLCGREVLARTQQHFAMAGEEYVRFVDKAADRLPAAPPPATFYPRQRSSPAWGMAIDLDLCIGCNACVVACVAENNVPMVGKKEVAQGRAMHWLRVDHYADGPEGEERHVVQPVPCMHCEDAPCEMGCPVNATVHSPDGINLQVYNRCIGTRTCSAYCPYKVRRFNWFDLTRHDPPELRMARNPDVTVRGRGVMEKCTYCLQRVAEARIAADKEDRPIRDGEVMTACQAACPTQAIVFGDVSDTDTAVSRRKADGRDYVLLPEANTRPRTTYQARIRRGTA
jgi:molybdopterin-containing oxidoreductase family iron-sulfur binding subunit